MLLKPVSIAHVFFEAIGELRPARTRTLQTCELRLYGRVRPGALRADQNPAVDEREPNRQLAAARREHCKGSSRLSRRPGHPCGSVHFWRMGSADRSPSARPCRPATVFDFPPPLARACARAARRWKCWRFFALADPLQAALRLAPLIIPVV